MRVFNLIPFIILFITLPAKALLVDKMFLISDKRGNGILTLTNDDKQASFINTKITEIKTDKYGELSRMSYTKANIDDWKIITTNPKLILESQRTKDVGIRALCITEECAGSKDLMFSISFEPAPYFAEGEKAEEGVRINYGYAPLYIIPALNGNIEYEIKNLGDQLDVFNKGNTMIRARIDQCSSNTDSNCEVVLNVIAGRHKVFDLPENIRANSLLIEVTNFDESYRMDINVDQVR